VGRFWVSSSNFDPDPDYLQKKKVRFLVKIEFYFDFSGLGSKIGVACVLFNEKEG